MKFVVADYETYFDSKTYTLSKMSTEAYIRDPRFEAHGLAVKWSAEQPAVWYDNAQWRTVAPTIDWSDVFLIHHHAQFDGLINSHHYNIHPKLYGCTLSMARMMLGNHLSVSLEQVRRHFGMHSKSTPYQAFDGKRWHELSPAVQQQIAVGACDEVESIWAIFQRFMEMGFPREEIEVVDATIKMFTEPVLRADIDLLGKVWEDEANKKQARLQALNVTASDLQSSDRFAQLLRDEGLEPEQKDGKNGAIYAFAKTDEFMRELVEHPNERIRTLAEARLGAKSTLMQTRAETLGFMASRGPMPVYLRYSGAHTKRWSGGDGANWQNFRRGSDIRRAIMAPEGHLLAPIDLSQVECRILNYLAGQWDIIEKFKNGEDPYVSIASQAYGEKVYKAARDDPRAKEMETKRGTGKQLELSCLGPHTLVLTDRGLYPITAVKTNMRVWDGVEWVKHFGLASKGERSVVNIEGVWLTPDHLVLSGNTWAEAAQLQNANILYRALASASANLPSPATSSALKAASATLWLGALVARLNMRCTLQICLRAEQLGVMLAPKKRAAFGRKNTTATLTSCPTTRTAAGYLAASAQFLRAAIAKLRATITPTEDGGFACTNRGGANANYFSPTSLNCRVGITHASNWTGATIIAATYQGICALLPSRKIFQTGAPSKRSLKKMPVYDIVCAGPRNRFTIVSAAGPLIVHNCGYQAGAATIQNTARLGIYGPPVVIDMATATAWRDLYRNTHPAVVDYWKVAGRMIARIAGGEPMEWGPMLIKDKKIFGPGGTFLDYSTLEFKQPSPDEGEREGYWRIKTRQGWSKLYSGRLVENVVQWLARIVMSQAMVRMLRLGYRVVNTTHDEILVVLKQDGNEQRHLDICMGEMKRTPVWLPGIPLDCEASLSERYSK